MRLSNGFVIDKEKTFGELKFTAVRDVFLESLCAAWSKSFETFSNRVPTFATMVSSTQRNIGCVASESGIILKATLAVIFIKWE